MKNMIVVLLVLILMLVMSGCAVVDKAAGKVAKGVITYCVQPYEIRNVYRNTVNAKLVGTGHSVHVHCSGDPSPIIPTVTP